MATRLARIPFEVFFQRFIANLDELQLSGQGYTVLVIEAGPDAKNVSAVYDAEERGNLVRISHPMAFLFTKTDVER